MAAPEEKSQQPDQGPREIQVFVVPTELWAEVVELLQPMPFNAMHKTMVKLMRLRPQVATIQPDGTATFEPG